MHLSNQRHPSIVLKSFTKLLSMSFHVNKDPLHCWATSSDSLMYELKALNVNSSTWCATGCTALPSTVVCLLSGEPESLWHLNLPTTTAVCCCVCMSLGVTYCLCFGLLCDSVNTWQLFVVVCMSFGVTRQGLEGNSLKLPCILMF